MPEVSLFQQYLIRRGALFTERATWIPQYREISQFFMPRTGRFLITDQNKGDKRYNSIIDSTGTRAIRVLAAGLMAGMTSPARPWFRLGTLDTDLMEYAPVKLWLNMVSEKMRAIFSRSNTYRSLHMIYEEMGLYGTGATIVMDDFENVLHHNVTTCGEYMIAANYKGEVNTLYREFQMTVASLVAEFGIDKVSPGVKAMWDRGTLDAWVQVLHVIEPRADRARNLRSPLGRDLPFASNYMELAGANPNGYANQQFLREGGFKRFPCLVPRWHATGGDVYGNGPGMEALGDNKQLQHGQIRKAQAIDYSVKPPLQVPAALKNMPLATLPGGVSFYDQQHPNGGIRTAFDVKLDISGQIEDIRDVRTRIQQACYVDMFLMLAQADEGRQPPTAREVAEKHEEKLLMLGPVIERLDNELLKPFIDITFDRIVLAKMLRDNPPPPEMHGQELNVEFIGMLAQAQRAIGVGSIDRYIQTIGTIATFQANAGQPMTVLDKLNADEVADQYADMLGVDPKLIVADEQVAIIRQDRAAAQAKAQQAAAVPAGAAAAKDLSQAGPAGQQAVEDIIGKFSGYSGPGVPVAA
jgi:hypothetical protein